MPYTHTRAARARRAAWSTRRTVEGDTAAPLESAVSVHPLKSLSLRRLRPSVRGAHAPPSEWAFFASFFFFASFASFFFFSSSFFFFDVGWRGWSCAWTPSRNSRRLCATRASTWRFCSSSSIVRLRCIQMIASSNSLRSDSATPRLYCEVGRGREARGGRVKTCERERPERRARADAPSPAARARARHPPPPPLRPEPRAPAGLRCGRRPRSPSGTRRWRPRARPRARARARGCRARGPCRRARSPAGTTRSPRRRRPCARARCRGCCARPRAAGRARKRRAVLRDGAVERGAPLRLVGVGDHAAVGVGEERRAARLVRARRPAAARRRGRGGGRGRGRGEVARARRNIRLLRERPAEHGRARADSPSRETASRASVLISASVVAAASVSPCERRRSKRTASFAAVS